MLRYKCVCVRVCVCVCLFVCVSHNAKLLVCRILYYTAHHQMISTVVVVLLTQGPNSTNHIYTVKTGTQLTHVIMRPGPRYSESRPYISYAELANIPDKQHHKLHGADSHRLSVCGKNTNST